MYLLLHLFLGNIVFIIIVNGTFLSVTFLCYLIACENIMDSLNASSIFNYSFFLYMLITVSGNSDDVSSELSSIVQIPGQLRNL